MGVTGSYMLYDKENDTFYIANYGSMDFTEKSINDLITIRTLYDRIME
jgi:D-alanyl-D-alanine carboxypeptidase